MIDDQLDRRTLMIGLGLVVAAPALAGLRPVTVRLIVGARGSRTPGLGASTVSLSRPHLFSTSNDQQRWTLWVQTDAAVAEDQWLFLAHGDEVIQSNSTSRDKGRSYATFEMDRDHAKAWAERLQIEMRERPELGAGLVATLEQISGSTFRLTLRNDGAESVALVWGGRQRGPRNNRFHFVVEKDGKPLAEKDGADFGGISGLEQLAPGGSWSEEVDVASWAELSEGPYVVRWRYEAELVPGEFTQWPETAHQKWEPVFRGVTALP